MSTHLGRNPFEKKKRSAPSTSESTSQQKDSSPKKSKRILPVKEEVEEAHSSTVKSPAEKLLVDLPANTFMIALKGALLVKSFFDKSS
jgi:hypothetical protein